MEPIAKRFKFTYKDLEELTTVQSRLEKYDQDVQNASDQEFEVLLNESLRKTIDSVSVKKAAIEVQLHVPWTSAKKPHCHNVLIKVIREWLKDFVGKSFKIYSKSNIELCSNFDVQHIVLRSSIDDYGVGNIFFFTTSDDQCCTIILKLDFSSLYSSE